MGKAQEALKIQEEIILDLQRLNLVNGYVYLEIAECYQAMFLTEQAQPYFLSAHSLLKSDKWYSDNRQHDLERILKNSKKS